MQPRYYSTQAFELELYAEHTNKSLIFTPFQKYLYKNYVHIILESQESTYFKMSQTYQVVLLGFWET